MSSGITAGPICSPTAHSIRAPGVGHSPGSCCLWVPDLGTVFTGDTLFQGGPGATGRSFSSWEVILESINGVLFALPDHTVVHTGHGPDTTIGAERATVPAVGSAKPE